MLYYVGFDIGGTKCAISLGKVEGETLSVIDRYEVATTPHPTDTFSQFDARINDWITAYSVSKAGISCGGPLDSTNGVILCPPNLNENWYDFDVVSFVKTRYNLTAKLENDANACAVAEWLFGAGKNCKNMIFLTFGTGLGAGLILDGKLYSGTNGNAGEVGHIRLAPLGPIGYNKSGSAEGFCSGNGIKNLAIMRAFEQNKPIDKNVTTKEIFARANDGDQFYLSVVRESAQRFGEVLSILIDLFNPEVIVAGGVFMRNYDFFMRELQPVLTRESLSNSLSVCKILPAKINENIGDFGALALAKTIQ